MAKTKLHASQQQKKAAMENNASGSLRFPKIAFLVALISVAFSIVRSRGFSVLTFISTGQFDWGSSTTPIPISSVSPLVKALLSQDNASLPPGLRSRIPVEDTVEVQRVRDFVNEQRLNRLRRICRVLSCKFNEASEKFGLTPLHIASFSGDFPLMRYLQENGAVYKEDHVGRMPRNLSFTNFIYNSKKWAMEAGRVDCDFPIVEYDRSEAARKEVRRLVSEGEPVLIRGALKVIAPQILEWEADEFVGKHGTTPVTVGAVPYAAAFNLTTKNMKLSEYYEKFVKKESEAPLYVFSKGPEVCRDGYDAIVRLMKEAFPMPDLVAHPDETGGLDGIHFFLGQQGSGAPFHIHADAINAAVSGSKQWYVHTPQRTLYSRTPIKQWVDTKLGSLPDEQAPLECTQRPGDVVYVPLDWGHAVLNLDKNTFGFALEILNIRDTLMHIAGKR